MALGLSVVLSTFLSPLLANAGFFSFLLRSTASQTDASAPIGNSQTITILTPTRNSSIRADITYTNNVLMTSTTLVSQQVPFNYNRIDTGSYYRWPVAGGYITQGLHSRNGIDIGAKSGSPIFATADGIVVAVHDGGWSDGGYGNYILVEHSNGTQTLYAHAKEIIALLGQDVAQGQKIATVGTTGESTGPHLHFEVHGAKNPFGNLHLGTNQ